MRRGESEVLSLAEPVEISDTAWVGPFVGMVIWYLLSLVAAIGGAVVAEDRREDRPSVPAGIVSVFGLISCVLVGQGFVEYWVRYLETTPVGPAGNAVTIILGVAAAIGSGIGMSKVMTEDKKVGWAFLMSVGGIVSLTFAVYYILPLTSSLWASIIAP